MSNFDSPNPFQDNPYSSAPMSYSPMEAIPPVGTAQLASLMQRFLGAVVDSIFPALFVFPGYVMALAGVLMNEDQRQNGVAVNLPFLSITGIGIIGLGFVLTLILQIYLLATRSQTLGKLLLKTQIVDFETGKPADFVHCALLRILVNSFIAGVPCLGAVYALVDICFIFRDDRRCIHDLIASTTVIDISDR